MNSPPSDIDPEPLREVLRSITLGPEDNDERGTSAFLATLAGDPPRPVYHYTSAEGAHGILTNRELWASHSGFLNDTTERSHGLKRCVDRLRNRTGPHRRLTNSAADMLKATGDPESEAGFDLYVACFSAGNDILPQWMGYAAHGAGYALGFDLVKTAVVTDTTPLRVVYTEREQHLLVDVVIDGFVDVLTRSLEAHPRAKKETARGRRP